MNAQLLIFPALSYLQGIFIGFSSVDNLLATARIRCESRRDKSSELWKRAVGFLQCEQLASNTAQLTHKVKRNAFKYFGSFIVQLTAPTTTTRSYY